MRMVDLIEKKKYGTPLTKAEWHFIIKGFVSGRIPAYQMSALMMAICFNDMDIEETSLLTLEMMHSGDVLDLSAIPGIKLDKHSTGGVGDKTSLVLVPLIAACGIPIAKMSGRGLGHTGGTLDKLESIPGFNVFLDSQAFIDQVNKIGLAICGQTANLVPADKKMYALRDVTATVQSIPLIASSVMSKKLAAGTDAVLLDVKFGDGAFMKTKEDAELLARTMIDIGTRLGRDTRAAISNMSQPLGKAVGNILEVKEAIATLHGHGPDDFTELCLHEAATMLMMAKVVQNVDEGLALAKEKIDDGTAFEKFVAMVKAQGGDVQYVLNPSLFDTAQEVITIEAEESGYIADIKAMTIGLTVMKLGGGRIARHDTIDFTVGIILNKKVGDYVEKGEPLLYVHTNCGLSDELRDDIMAGYQFSSQPVSIPQLIGNIIK